MLMVRCLLRKIEPTTHFIHFIKKRTDGCRNVVTKKLDDQKIEIFPSLLTDPVFVIKKRMEKIEN